MENDKYTWLKVGINRVTNVSLERSELDQFTNQELENTLDKLSYLIDMLDGMITNEQMDVLNNIHNELSKEENKREME